ncbi:MBL fold metallo-hydrolase [Cohnella kolymensis]|uniref:MBL fold metallo-hydrolase n=1 Tax=Cohnella kolymensis TaxID=1590652 RepID=UPI0006977B5F|nr:MBL fold metallo-hydrolase [Cohnella kolymensis]
MEINPNNVIKLTDGWLQLKVPVPFSLKWVNSYLLPEQIGWTLIDPGLRTPATESFWTTALAVNSIRWEDIKRVVVTHHHPDHYGLAGWFQERTGAPVFMSQTAYEAAHRLWGDDEMFSGELTEAFLQNGMLPELAENMNENLLGFHVRVSPHPRDVTFLEAGVDFRMGGLSWETIGGEGHAPGHLSFYHAESGRLICADQVLPDISPNIGWMPGGDPDPLGSYLGSLRELLPLRVETAFPGHRAPFAEFQKRVQELLDHHERRLLKMMELIGSHTLTAFEVCELVFGSRYRDNPHQLRFALAETIAHLLHLERRGTLVRVETDSAELIRYRRRNPLPPSNKKPD